MTAAISPAPAHDDRPAFLRAAHRLLARFEEGDPIDRFLLANRIAPTPLNRDNARRLLAGEAPAVSEEGPSVALAEELARLIDGASEKLAEARQLVSRSESDTRSFGSALTDSTQAADAGTPLIDMVLGLTRTMIERTQEAEARLRAMGGEMSDMRGDLEEARRSAEVDPLTGLANRRAYERRLARAVAAADEGAGSVVLAVCDVDHFKAINDTHGHEMGDRILRFIGGILRGVEDEDTLVARYGGEEFVILFEHLPIGRVAETVDALRADLATRRLIARDTGAPVGEVTFSAGVAALSEGDAVALFRAADAALYEAKRGGRDRVVVARD